jgi:DNA-binding response OmpR family regulator
LRSPRVFIACSDNSLMRRLHDAFGREGNFEVCGDAIHRAKAVDEAIELHPDLVILELGSSPQEGFRAAKVLKRARPDLPIFLITERHDMEHEKEALSSGIDAVFEKDFDFKSLIMNARAVCGLTSSNL